LHLLQPSGFPIVLPPLGFLLAVALAQPQEQRIVEVLIVEVRIGLQLEMPLPDGLVIPGGQLHPEAPGHTFFLENA